MTYINLKLRKGIVKGPIHQKGLTSSNIFLTTFLKWHTFQLSKNIYQEI